MEFRPQVRLRFHFPIPNVAIPSLDFAQGCSCLFCNGATTTCPCFRSPTKSSCSISGWSGDGGPVSGFVRANCRQTRSLGSIYARWIDRRNFLRSLPRSISETANLQIALDAPVTTPLSGAVRSLVVNHDLRGIARHVRCVSRGQHTVDIEGDLPRYHRQICSDASEDACVRNLGNGRMYFQILSLVRYQCPSPGMAVFCESLTMLRLIPASPIVSKWASARSAGTTLCYPIRFEPQRVHADNLTWQRGSHRICILAFNGQAFHACSGE